MTSIGVTKTVGRLPGKAPAREVIPGGKKATKSGWGIIRGHGSPSYVVLFKSDAFERIAIIKNGLLAADAKSILADLDIPQAATLRALNIAAATMNRKAKGEGRLPPAESERVLGVARLVGQVQAMVDESGNPQGFDAAAWTSRWLSEPLPALGGVRPLDLLDTMEGQTLVSSTLTQIQSGAYA
jgi:putative toxin-antitoxin system antitoxin component (TIGR02293 family)